MCSLGLWVSRSPSIFDVETEYNRGLIGNGAGGYLGDLVYHKYGVSTLSYLKGQTADISLQVPGKKYLTLACGVLQGALCLALGFYIDSKKKPDRKLLFLILWPFSLIDRLLRQVATVIGVMCVLAIFNEMGNGANFSLVPHCNARKKHFLSKTLAFRCLNSLFSFTDSNGMMSGLVGACGNLVSFFLWRPVYFLCRPEFTLFLVAAGRDSFCSDLPVPASAPRESPLDIWDCVSGECRIFFLPLSWISKTTISITRA